MDALTVAFTTYSHVQYLNNMNARRDENNDKFHTVYGIEQKYLYRNENNKLLFNPPLPIKELRSEAKQHLENILVSFKAKNKVVTRNKNKTKIKGKEKYKTKVELTPRGQLHKETIYGQINRYETKEEKICATFDFEKIGMVANKKYKEALLQRLLNSDGNPQKAFAGKNALSRNPIYLDDEKIHELPEKVKLVWQEKKYTTRKEISHDLKIEKVIDVGVRGILQDRLNEFKGDSKKAFSNLEQNPIWLNKEKGIAIKSVTITGVNNVEALHYKKDHFGKAILDNNGKKQPVDFVSTGNNHHVAIYRDKDGNLQEDVVSFYDAVARVNQELPIIWKNHPEHPDWNFLFTMKQNEYFVFPYAETGFNPNEIDLLDSDNYALISPNLFRVQSVSSKYYIFNHQYETKNADGELFKNKKQLSKVTFQFLRTPANLDGIVKVRVNHIGQIVSVGEY